MKAKKQIALLTASVSVLLAPAETRAQEPAPAAAAPEERAAPEQVEDREQEDGREEDDAEQEDEEERQKARRRKVASRSKQVSLMAREGVAFHRIDANGKPDAVRICLVPCRVEFVGDQRFALSLDGDDPVLAPEHLRLRAGSVVEGEYKSNSSKRNIGFLVLGLGIPSGIATAAAGAGLVAEGDTDARAVGAGTIAGGATVFVVSLVLGLALSLSGDEAHVHANHASR